MENTDGSYSDGFAIDYLGLHTDYKGEDMLDLAISMLSELSLRLHNVTFSRNIFPFFFFVLWRVSHNFLRCVILPKEWLICSLSLSGLIFHDFGFLRKEVRCPASLDQGIWVLRYRSFITF